MFFHDYFLARKIATVRTLTLYTYNILRIMNYSETCIYIFWFNKLKNHETEKSTEIDFL